MEKARTGFKIRNIVRMRGEENEEEIKNIQKYKEKWRKRMKELAPTTED